MVQDGSEVGGNRMRSESEALGQESEPVSRAENQVSRSPIARSPRMLDKGSHPVYLLVCGLL